MTDKWKKIDTIVFLIGAIIASWAAYTYRLQKIELENTNKIQVALSLRSAENEIYKLTYEKDYLMAFFADPPEGMDPNINMARQQINLFLDIKKKEKLKDEWHNVKDLLKIIYDGSDNKKFYRSERIKLRQAYDLAEHLLYLLHDAYDANKRKILLDEDFATWRPYIDDLGFHPLFLAAIYYGHSSGYMTKDFAKFLKTTLLKSDRNRKAIGVLYNDMLKDNWVDMLGKREYDSPQKQ